MILRLIGRVAEGSTLSQACREEPGAPSRAAVVQAILRSEELGLKWLEARSAQFSAWEDEMLQIADGEDDPAKVRNRLEIRKWLMSKLQPGKYGERLQAEVSGVGGGPIVFSWLPPEWGPQSGERVVRDEDGEGSAKSILMA